MAAGRKPVSIGRAVSTSKFHLLLSVLTGASKTNCQQLWWKLAAWKQCRGAELNSSLFKALIPENYYLISLVSPWKTICKAVVFDLTQNLSMSNAFLYLGGGWRWRGKHLSEKEKGRMFHLILLGPQWLWSEICLFQCSGFLWVPAAAAVTLAAAKSSLGSWGTREWK